MRSALCLGCSGGALGQVFSGAGFPIAPRHPHLRLPDCAETRSALFAHRRQRPPRSIGHQSPWGAHAPADRASSSNGWPWTPRTKVCGRDVGPEPPLPVTGPWIHAAFTPVPLREA